MKGSKFQLIVMGVCVLLAFIGVFVFAIYKKSSQTVKISITVWGTLERRQMDGFLSNLTVKNSEIDVTYAQKSAATFVNEYTNALALGQAPDAILLPHDILFSLKDKIVMIPSESYPVSTYRSTFIPESELFISPKSGLFALPFAVDPMVMYWNRDLFSNANIPLPPTTWEEFLTLPSLLTKRDNSLTINQSAVALGEYSNISNAKEIISLLILQAGSPITAASNGIYRPVLDQAIGNTSRAADSALSFYTMFADPVKQVYSWNRSLPLSKQYFTSNKLALYFGFASELPEIRSKNPNLNFDVALVPQAKAKSSATPKMTFGRLYGLAISRSAANPGNVLSAIASLTTQPAQSAWAMASGLPSVRRDTLSVNPTAQGSAVFTTSALLARGWYDPNSVSTEAIFRKMVENITSGRKQIGDAIGGAQSELQILMR